MLKYFFYFFWTRLPEKKMHTATVIICLFSLRMKTANGDYRKEHRERSRSPIDRAAAPTVSIHANHMYASIPSLTMDQPLALTKNSMDATRSLSITPTMTSVERQQVLGILSAMMCSRL